MTTPAPTLSPAAQAVRDAAINAYSIINNQSATMEGHAAQIASHLLIVAADQVVPEPLMIVEGGRTYEEAWTATVHDDIRRKFLALAAELRQEGRA